MRVSEVDHCTSTAADIHSGPFLREVQQLQCAGTYDDRLVNKMFWITSKIFNQLLSGL